MNHRKLENKLIDSVKQKNGGALPDERQQQINSIALNTGLILGVSFDSIMMIYYLLTRNLEKAYPYVAQLIVIGVGVCLASCRKGEVSLPKTLTGKVVNPGKGWQVVLSRFLWCALDALAFAAVITVFDIYTEGQATGGLALDGIIAFLIFTVLNVICCELRVRRYRKWAAALDAEENNLED